MIDVLLEFTQKAGKYLRAQQKNIKPILNKSASVESVVTKADLYVSNLFEKTIKKHFSYLNYLIIDEEKITKFGDDVFEKIEASEYQFVIDPVDGTLQYTHNHPLYGLTVGVYKNRKPLLGIIYLPELNELTYFDGKKAWWVQKAFQKKAVKTELLPGTKSKAPLIFGHHWLWKISDKFSTSKALLVDYYSAVSQSFYCLTGRAKGYCMKLNLWDIAGTIPLADYLGMKIHEYASDKIYDGISAEYFNPNMSTRSYAVLCYPEDFAEIKSLISPRK